MAHHWYRLLEFPNQDPWTYRYMTELGFTNCREHLIIHSLPGDRPVHLVAMWVLTWTRNVFYQIALWCINTSFFTLGSVVVVAGRVRLIKMFRGSDYMRLQTSLRVQIVLLAIAPFECWSKLFLIKELSFEINPSIRSLSSLLSSNKSLRVTCFL